MTAEDPSPDFPEYDSQTAEVWDTLAAWWDDRIGDGNDFQDYLIEPATERLLALKHDELVLDIACGAGRFARRMANLGARIVAIDHSGKFIQCAQERTTENAERITYRVLSATDHDALLSLGEKRFDIAVCTMALMDMSSIEPLISTLPKLLKSGGRFVFSVTHPVFNSGTARHVAEQSDQDGEIIFQAGVKVTDYARPFHFLGAGIMGQPAPQHLFHRPVSLLFNTCFKYGFVLDGMEEPTFPNDADLKSRMPLSFMNMRAIPPVLVARMVLK
jgi:2-polyprenyl-3-methyl-5-hydroxy-6-metoxy-1,4-benzoquinol methylase